MSVRSQQNLDFEAVVASFHDTVHKTIYFRWERNRDGERENVIYCKSTSHTLTSQCSDV